MDFDPVTYINDPAWHSSVYGLERIDELLARLGSPHKQLKFVHVAGTNGKGSVCAYLDSVLREAGYKTGLFTSPYIETFEERIRVNGENISTQDLCDVTLAVREAAEAMAEEDPANHPTEFELMCAVAMLHFAQSNCDIVVAEVGLGGRWDATNVIPAPEVCVMARIGLDHTDLLGNTTGEIAAEKAGIIKAGTTVISWPQDADALASIQVACAAAGVPLTVADLEWLAQEPVRLDGGVDELGGFGGDGLNGDGTLVPQSETEVPSPAVAAVADTEVLSPLSTLPDTEVPSSLSTLPVRQFTYKGEAFETQLLASYQPSNAALAIEAVRALQQRGWAISEEALHVGIKQARWPGRFEVMQRHPLVIVDGGHNPQGAAVLAETLADVLPASRPVFVVGILADKDYGAMLEAVVDLGSAFVCVTPPSPRALPAEELAAAVQALRSDATVSAAPNFDDAVAQAFELAGENGVVCAFGSLYSIHDLKQALRQHGVSRQS